MIYVRVLHLIHITVVLITRAPAAEHPDAPHVIARAMSLGIRVLLMGAPPLLVNDHNDGVFKRPPP